MGVTGDGVTCADVDECAANNGGCDTMPMASCTNNVAAPASCDCPPTLSGDGVGVDGCVLGDACLRNNGNCGNALRWTCLNNPGNPPTCTDINECLLNRDNCSDSPSATCANTAGSFTCACPVGYTGDGVTCTDVDECASNNGGCSITPMVACTNTTGSRSCGACPAGYTGTGVGNCADINECSLNTDGCSSNPDACVNTPGGFNCVCPTGSTGNGVTCVDTNECLGTNVCTAAYPCVNLVPNYTCRGQFADWPVSSVPSYFENGDGTVTDLGSGLLWQQNVPEGINDIYTQATATAYCTGLSLAGAGWRLPTKAELESIVVDYENAGRVTATVFGSRGEMDTWSSSPYVGSGGRGWLVDFSNGASAHDPTGYAKLVRCVRSTAPAVASSGGGGAPPGRYTFPGAGTVYDTRTQLTWQRMSDAGFYRQTAAFNHCTQLSLAGAGWRLPTVRELLTLVDTTRVNPAIDISAFPSTPVDRRFWSSTAGAGGSSGIGWAVDFDVGGSVDDEDISENRVRCVR
jgi:hypothetical protein